PAHICRTNSQMLCAPGIGCAYAASAVTPSSASSTLGPCHAAPSKDNRSCVSIRSTSRLIGEPHSLASYSAAREHAAICCKGNHGQRLLDGTRSPSPYLVATRLCPRRTDPDKLAVNEMGCRSVIKGECCLDRTFVDESMQRRAPLGLAVEMRTAGPGQKPQTCQAGETISKRICDARLEPADCPRADACKHGPRAPCAAKQSRHIPL